MKLKVLAALPVVVCWLVPGLALATPSTTFWAPSTTYVQPFGVLHVTYDSYFNDKAAYSPDVGLTMGVLPWKRLQAEVGFDLIYPTVASSGPVAFPIILNAKIGAPEDAYFPGQPSWSFGIYGVGFEAGVNNQNALHLMAGRNFPWVGSLNLGAYYGLNAALFESASGTDQRLGLMAGWSSPAIDVPGLDKLIVAWDVQTGDNVLGATGGGVYVYVTPGVDLLLGPVFFFEKELQPGTSSWMWSAQLDIDIDLLHRAQD